MTTRILMILALALTGFTATTVVAGELDNEAKVINEQALRAKELPQTVVVRIDQKTGEASVLESTETLAQDEKTVAALHTSRGFVKLNAAGTSELDRTSSSSSWFYYYPRGHYYAPTYYYSNYSYYYQPCYSYTYYGYAYAWYRW